MYYYQYNNEIITMPDEQAEVKKQKREIKQIEKVNKINDEEVKYYESEVVTTEIKYIEMLAGTRWTQSPPPDIKKKQRLSIDRTGEWVIEDKTPEEITRDMAEEFAQIDRETEAKIFEGFDYDGKRFSMSISAQANWLYLFTLYESGQFPKEGFPIATKDDAEYVLVKKKAPPFFQAATTHKETALAEGRKRKAELRSQYE